MKLSINWLKEYVDVNLTTEELIHRLTMAGLEVEATESIDGDTVLELEITPNRPDCLSTIGLAREIAAITSRNLKLPKVKTYKSSTSSPLVKIDDPKDCSLYIATLIKGVQIAASPASITKHLNALGLRPINNAVDVTNFVLMETGQPLHAFDYDTLSGGKLIVRRAKKDERLVTLDGIERKLDPSILVIADLEKPVAIAGVMGGMATQITDKTKNILLESAHFDLGVVRRAGRALGLKSDSSYRFERGVDGEGIAPAANRATEMICALTKGQASGRWECGKARVVKKEAIKLKISDITDLLGTPVKAQQVKAGLARLGLKVSAKGETLTVSSPSFRGDLNIAEDIIEEIARIIGYDHLNVSLPTIKAANIVTNAQPRKIRQAIATALVAKGLSETITFSLISKKECDAAGLASVEAVELVNSLSQAHDRLRPSLLPSLLNVAATNIHRGQKEVRVFEIGKRYDAKGEYWTLGILMTGRRTLDWRGSSKAWIDFYDLKGVLEGLFSSLRVAIDLAPASTAGLLPEQTIAMSLNKTELGFAGKIDPAVVARWDIKNQNLYFAQIDLMPLLNIPNKVVAFKSLPEYPAVGRDISLAVAKTVGYAAIEQACRHNGGDILQNILLVEEYTGDKIAADLRGLVLSLTYQAHDRTLTEAEVNAQHAQILKVLTTDLKATIR